jgi:hypothetical protein
MKKMRTADIHNKYGSHTSTDIRIKTQADKEC